MRVHNVHTRAISAPPHEVGALIDTLAGEDDRLWPVAHWPPMRFDKGLRVGARGGHGPVRYEVVAHDPGRSVRFRFLRPRGLDGYHECAVEPDGEHSLLRHRLVARTSGTASLTWPLFWEPMHDACLEDCFDRAEREATGTVREPARWSARVRLMHRLAASLPG